MQETWIDSILLAISQAFTNAAVYFPRLLAAVLILFFGTWAARIFRRMIRKVFVSFAGSDTVKKTPAEHFFDDAELGHKLEDVLGSVVYWLMMLVVLYVAVSVLGIASLSMLLEKIINYIPHILAAILILVVGVLFAGIAEGLVKNAFRAIDTGTARALGKLTGYVVVIISALAAVSELGIAREFILILFVGLIFMLSLGFGLAIGLGGQDLVRDVLKHWYASHKRQH